MHFLAESITISTALFAVISALIAVLGVVAGLAVSWGSMSSEIKSLRESFEQVRAIVTQQSKAIQQLERDVAVLSDRAKRSMSDAE